MRKNSRVKSAASPSVTRPPCSSISSFMKEKRLLLVLIAPKGSLKKAISKSISGRVGFEYWILITKKYSVLVVSFKIP